MSNVGREIFVLEIQLTSTNNPFLIPKETSELIVRESLCNTLANRACCQRINEPSSAASDLLFFAYNHRRL